MDEKSYLFELPGEIRSHIFKFLPILSLSNLTQVSKEAAALTLDEFIRNFKCRYDMDGMLDYGYENEKPGLIKFLLSYHLVDPSYNDNQLIIWASKNGHLEIVKLLLMDQRVDLSIEENMPVRWASVNGHLEIVKLLLMNPRIDPSDHMNESIRWASKNGHLGIVKLLLVDSRVDPMDISPILIDMEPDQCCALENAIFNGHTEIVKLLLRSGRLSVTKCIDLWKHGYEQADKRVIPSDYNHAIKIISKENRWKTAKLLLADSQIDPIDIFPILMDMKPDQYNALENAIINGYIITVKLLQ